MPEPRQVINIGSLQAEKVTFGDFSPIGTAGTPDDLPTAPLVNPDVRGETGAEPESEVRCGRPLVYPVAPEALPEVYRLRLDAYGGRAFGLLLAFDLPRENRLRMAEFTVDLQESGVVAIQID